LNERNTDTCGDFLTRPSLSHPFTPIWSRHPRLSDRYTTASLFSASTKANKTSAGSSSPDAAKEKPQQGTVIAAGNGKVKDNGKRIPLDVKAGDRILFGKYTGQEIKLDGEEYLIMKEDDVLAVIEGQTKKKLAAIKGKTQKKKK
jgi:chaperonin GroES